MTRSIFLTVLFLILPFSVAIAQTAPTQPVRAIPAAAKAGNTVSLEAFVYNATAKTVTVDVLFAAPEEEIETIALTISTQSAKTATATWTVPETATVVTASIVKAVDANQRNVPELLGVLGTVTVGSAPSAFSIGKLGIGAKTWAGKALAMVEPWRIAQAQHFTKLRDAKRAELGIDSSADLTARLAPPKNPEPSAAPEDPQRMGDLAPKGSFPIESYATLLFASGLAAIFSSAALFYITGILLILFVVRFFPRMFS